MITRKTPLLVTFDGEARSGKGTIIQATKDYLRDESGYKTMLIDRGQTFRALVVAAERAGIDLEDPDAIDAYLENSNNINECVKFVKVVYRMTKEDREKLLYTNRVGVDSAKIGARPLSQAFVKSLTKKWVSDAGKAGYAVVLIDGRALETVALEMHSEGLCVYRLGLYFTCDAQVGARRTLGYAGILYKDLTAQEKSDVDLLVEQIGTRNYRDSNDRVGDEDRLVPPANSKTYRLPEIPRLGVTTGVPMYILDTSAEQSKADMSLPVAQFVADVLSK